MAAGVWVGLDEHETLGDRETGSRAALPIWIEFMRAVLKERSYQYFDRPDGVVQVAIDPVSGAVVPENDPTAQKALIREDRQQGSSS